MQGLCSQSCPSAQPGREQPGYSSRYNKSPEFNLVYLDPTNIICLTLILLRMSLQEVFYFGNRCREDHTSCPKPGHRLDKGNIAVILLQ